MCSLIVSIISPEAGSAWLCQLVLLMQGERPTVELLLRSPGEEREWWLSCDACKDKIDQEKIIYHLNSTNMLRRTSMTSMTPCSNWTHTSLQRRKMQKRGDNCHCNNSAHALLSKIYKILCENRSRRVLTQGPHGIAGNACFRGNS